MDSSIHALAFTAACALHAQWLDGSKLSDVQNLSLTLVVLVLAFVASLHCEGKLLKKEKGNA